MGELLENAKAIDVVKQMVADGQISQDVAENYFPELKESEDERIRKAIVKMMSDIDGGSPFEKYGIIKKEALAWLEKQSKNNMGIPEATKKKLEDNLNKALEKETAESWNKFLDEQGEQKPTDKFHEGDWVVISTSDGEKVVQIDSIEYFKNGKPRYITSEGRWFSNGTEARLWNIAKDAKDGDVLVASDGSIFIFKGTINCACKHYIALATDGAIEINEGLKHYWETSRAVHPATKEQRDTIMKAMADTGYTFDFKKKELKKIEKQPSQWDISDYRTWQYIVADVLTKHDGIGQYLDNGFCKKIAKYMQEEWSKKLCLIQHTDCNEEDEDTIKFLISHFCVSHCNRSFQFTDNKLITHDELLEKIRNLRLHWKPNNDQMDALDYYANSICTYSDRQDDLRSLFNDLKKLITK